MFRRILIVIGGLSVILWGTTHIIIPTKQIADGVYGALSINNKYIILMEWITEGMTLIFIGLLVIIAAIINENNKTTKSIYILSPIMLFSMAILSVFTGYNIDNLPFKLCPYIFSASGILILQGAFRNKRTAWPI